VLEIAEPPQLVADLIDGRERPLGHGRVWTGVSGRLGLTWRGAVMGGECIV
jgi:hypothetical protein